jgi:membrane protein implicated in regulation of membrane protease activity
MDTSNSLTWVFGAMTLLGVLYFLITILSGSDLIGDIDLPGIDVGDGFGCTILAVFLAGFGSIGLLGVSSGWNLVTTIIAALVFGLILGRLAVGLLRYVFRQQSGTIQPREGQLIGTSARVTIDSPEGKTGEAMIEGEHIEKYPVKEVNGAALRRGDHVEFVEINGGILYVKKKRML